MPSVGKVWSTWHNHFRKQFGKTILQKVLPLNKTVLTPEQAILLRQA